MKRISARSRLGTVLLSGAVLLVWSGAALAKAPPPKAKNSSAIAQYRESIPTPSGPTYPGPGPSASTPLPAPVVQKVEAQGGPDARVLKVISTREDRGAPQQPLPPLRPRQAVIERGNGSGNAHALLSNTGGVITDGENGRLLGLIVVMGVLTLAAAALAVRRRATAT